MFRSRLAQILLIVLVLVPFGCEDPAGVSDITGPWPVTGVNHYDLDSVGWPQINYSVDSIWLEGIMLYLNVECAAEPIAEFNLFAWNSHIDSWPPAYHAVLRFRSAGDSSPRKQYRLLFNLSPLKAVCREYNWDFYRDPDLSRETVLRLWLEGSSTDLWYDF